MKIKVLRTGSNGNCYLLSVDAETLILDCGISIAEIKKGLDFDIKRVVGCLVTHCHKDHSESKERLKKMGVNIFAPYELGELDTAHTVYGSFDITAFRLPHDDTKNFGFLIKVKGQKILYLTDFEYCKYKFTKKRINHILVECNYQDELVNRDLPNYEHKIRGHCSLKTCKEFIEVNTTNSLRSVLLLHMGHESCNAKECVEEVKKVAKNAQVDYARAGLEIELETNECPFL